MTEVWRRVFSTTVWVLPRQWQATCGGNWHIYWHYCKRARPLLLLYLVWKGGNANLGFRSARIRGDVAH